MGLRLFEYPGNVDLERKASDATFGTLGTRTFQGSIFAEKGLSRMLDVYSKPPLIGPWQNAAKL